MKNTKPWAQKIIINGALFLLCLPLATTSAQTPLPLTTEQIIQQAELQFNGRVSSVIKLDHDNVYQLRLLTSSAQLLLINVDAISGEMKQQHAPLKTNDPLKN